MVRIGFILSLAGGSAALALAYSRAGPRSVAIALIVIAAAWLLAYVRDRAWLAGPALLAFVALAAFGLWIQLSAALMITGALGALLAWDLQQFSLRLKHALPTEDVRGMERRHMARLGVVTMVGLSLATLAALVDFKLSAGMVLGLAVLSALGLLRLGLWLAGRGD